MSSAVVNLGDVASFVRGINFKPDDVVALGGPDTVACMRTKNVQAELDLGDVWGVSEAFVRRPEQFLRCGDVLVSSANSWNLVGKCSWIPDLPWRASFGGFVSVLRANLARVDARYLYRWFAWDHTQALLRSFGQKTTNISNLNLERALALCLPLPALDEQRRIAAILDQAETLRAQRRAAIAQLDSLGQAVFLEMFGDPRSALKRWRYVRMAETFAAPPIYGTMVPAEADGRAWLCLRVANIQDWQLDLSDKKFVDLPQSSVRRHEVLDGDLLMARAIASQSHLGKCVVVRSHGQKWAFDSHLMRLRFDKAKAEPEFIRHMLRTPGGRGIFLGASRRSAVQFNINTKEIAALEFPLPPIDYQRLFVQRTESIEQLKSGHHTALSHLNDLFASLQHRAFRGEL